jgi:hypothetical protein
MTVMAEDGFLAEISIDEEAGVLRGVIVNHRECAIRFEAETVPLLREAMRASVAKLTIDAHSQGRPAPQPAFFVKPEEVSRYDGAEFFNDERITPRGVHYLPISASVYNLLCGLYVAADEYEEIGDNGRRGAIRACASIITFLMSRGESMRLAGPFSALFRGLNDVSSGTVPSIFDVKRKQMKRPREEQYKHVKDIAAALLEVYFYSKSSSSYGKEPLLRPISNEIARYVARWPSVPPHTKITGQTIETWRDDANTREKKDRLDYDRLIEHLKDLSPEHREAEIRRCLSEGPPGYPSARDRSIS